MRGFARGGAGSGAAAAAAAPPQPTPQPLLAATAVAVAPARGAPCAGGWRTARMETSAGAGAAGTVVEKQQQRPPKRKRPPKITMGFLKQLVQEAVPGADTIEAALEVYVFTYGGNRGLLDHVDAVVARKGPLTLVPLTWSARAGCNERWVREVSHLPFHLSELSGLWSGGTSESQPNRPSTSLSRLIEAP